MSEEIVTTKKKLLEEFRFLREIERQEFPFYMGEAFDEFEEALYTANIKLMHEGLIKSYPMDFAIDRLFEFGVAGKNDKGTCILVGLKDPNRMQELLRKINILGYFVSQYKLLPKGKTRGFFNFEIYKTFNEIPKDLNQYREIWVSAEPKFDRTIDTSKIKHLYHLTEKIYLPNIYEKGLIPKSKKKKAYHPERIYITTNIDDLGYLIEDFTRGRNINDFVILEIDYEKAGRPILYNDPNFMRLGYYIIDNITPNAIDDEFDINEYS